MTEQEKVAFLYDTFLKASKEPDRRPATDAELIAHMEGWKDGLYVDAVAKTAQMRQIRAAAPTKSSIMKKLFGCS